MPLARLGLSLRNGCVDSTPSWIRHDGICPGTGAYRSESEKEAR